MNDPKEIAHLIHEILQDDMKRVSLSELRPNHHRTYPYQFVALIKKAQTIGDIVTAYQKFASSHGAHDGLTEADWYKIEQAKANKSILEVPAVG